MLQRAHKMPALRFLSTPSARRATAFGIFSIVRVRNFYPRPPRGGRRPDLGAEIDRLHISIHALREEGDDAATLTLRAQIAFLSTPSARRATRAVSSKHSSLWHFYPRPPRGGRPLAFSTSRPLSLFLSTPSARRATNYSELSNYGLSISIHALREEGDRPALPAPAAHLHFYPRPPRGGRRLRPCNPLPAGLFLSTPSARRATGCFAQFCVLLRISIHALREEGDLPESRTKGPYSAFLSTPSARRATRLDQPFFWEKEFLSTPSARRATRGI